MTSKFNIGDIVSNGRDTTVEVWEFYEYEGNKKTFGGIRLEDGDVSACWLIKKFKKVTAIAVDHIAAAVQK